MLGGFSEGRIARCHPVSVLTGFDDVELGVASPQACVEVMGVPMNQLLRPSLGDIGGGLVAHGQIARNEALRSERADQDQNQKTVAAAAAPGGRGRLYFCG